MRNGRIALLIAGLLFCSAALAAPMGEQPYDRTVDLVYGQAKGQDLCMDIFVPNGKARHAYYQPNDNGQGFGIIDIVSGGWNGSRARMKEHEDAQLYGIFCARKYTVFAIRVGSLPDFTGLEMVENVKRGIRWVKAHAAEYGVDPERLGLVGASAGGHLGCMAAVTADAGDPNASDPLLRLSSQVKAISVFFPPTDFLQWKDGKPADVNQEPYLMFPDGAEGKTEEEILAAMAAISPARQIHGKTPPFLIIHGDQDPIVPLRQSEIMVENLHAAGNSAELYVKQGGGHFWLTIPEEMIRAANWFDARLRE